MSLKLPTLSLGVIPFAFAFAFAISMAFGPTPIGAEVYTSVWDLKRVAKFGKELHQSIPEGPMRSSTFYTRLSDLLPCLFDVRDRVYLDPISILRMVSLFAKALNATTADSPDLRDFITRQAASLKVELPADDDVIGAANSIVRLQVVYNVTVSSLARHGFRSSFKLDSIHDAVELPTGCVDALVPNAQDCASVARYALTFNPLYVKVSKLWMKRAVDMSLNGGRVPLLDAVRLHARQQDVDVHPNIAVVFGIVEKSLLELVDKADRDSTFDFASAVDDFLRVDDEVSVIGSIHKPPNSVNLTDTDEYLRLCRESIFEAVVPAAVATKSELKCTYESFGEAYYQIGPVKTEWLTVDSIGLRVYYDVLSDADIEKLEGLALLKLNRSTMVMGHRDDRRVSKTAWLDRLPSMDDLRFVLQFNARCNSLASMNERGTEPPQVVNYGLGGHFDLHYDPFPENSPDQWTANFGSRMATLMFYLSDVEAGGSTVFTRLGIAIRPKKGSAVFWHNLLRNGALNLQTRHAGCAVASGEKWVLNKWYHYYPQLDKYPCTTDPNF